MKEGARQGGAGSHLGSTSRDHYQVGSAALEDGHPEGFHDLRDQALSRVCQGRDAKVKKKMNLGSAQDLKFHPSQQWWRISVLQYTLRHPASESAT